VGTAPALAKGTASIESASGAERAAAARLEALEPGSHDETGRKHKMPLQSEAGREVETLSREGEPRARARTKGKASANSGHEALRPNRRKLEA